MSWRISANELASTNPTGDHTLLDSIQQQRHTALTGPENTESSRNINNINKQDLHRARTAPSTHSRQRLVRQDLVHRRAYLSRYRVVRIEESLHPAMAAADILAVRTPCSNAAAAKSTMHGARGPHLPPLPLQSQSQQRFHQPIQETERMVVHMPQ